MKRIALLLLLCFAYSSEIFAQDTAYKYEYAIVEYNLTGVSRPTLIIYYGNEKMEDFAKLKNVKLIPNFFGNTAVIADLLNYMSEQGWELVGNSSGFSTHSHHYIFRREKKEFRE